MIRSQYLCDGPECEVWTYHPSTARWVLRIELSPSIEGKVEHQFCGNDCLIKFCAGIEPETEIPA